jgi:hypothetical protein
MNSFYFYALSTVGSCPRLLGKHVQKVSLNLTTLIMILSRLKWKENIFFPYAWQGQQTLTAICAKISNYVTLSFCTISMHIMLGTCVPNFKGRRTYSNVPCTECGYKKFPLY